MQVAALDCRTWCRDPPNNEVARRCLIKDPPAGYGRLKAPGTCSAPVVPVALDVPVLFLPAPAVPVVPLAVLLAPEATAALFELLPALVVLAVPAVDSRLVAPGAPLLALLLAAPGADELTVLAGAGVVVLLLALFAVELFSP